MPLLAIALAAVAGLVLSGGYYALVPLGAPPAVAPPDMPVTGPPAAVQAVVELVRSACVAGLVAGLATAAGWTSTGEALALGLALWVLPVVLLVGAVVHEGTSTRAALVHAGDWLLKLLAIGAIVGTLA